MGKRDRRIVRPREDDRFVLDGQLTETYDAVDYLISQGFSDSDARAYLRSLPRAGS